MKAAQNVVGLVGVTLGLIPLVLYLFTGGIGLWRLVVGEAPPVPWLYPLAVLVVAGVALVALDRDSTTRGIRR